MHLTGSSFISMMSFIVSLAVASVKFKSEFQ